MAGRSHHQAMKRTAYRIFTAAPLDDTPSDDSEELTESDVWGYPAEPVPPRQGEQLSDQAIPPARSKRGSDRTAASSMPVKIPDLSKILGSHGKNGGTYPAEGFGGDEDEGEESGRMVPPHELLWRSRTASMSVHEGIGRTLKGRDLRQVRNAVWKITGFQD